MQMPQGRNILGIHKEQSGGQCHWQAGIMGREWVGWRPAGAVKVGKLSRALYIILKTFAFALGEIGPQKEEAEPKSLMIIFTLKQDHCDKSEGRPTPQTATGKIQEEMMASWSTRVAKEVVRAIPSPT